MVLVCCDTVEFCFELSYPHIRVDASIPFAIFLRTVIGCRGLLRLLDILALWLIIRCFFMLVRCGPVQRCLRMMILLDLYC